MKSLALVLMFTVCLVGWVWTATLGFDGIMVFCGFATLVTGYCTLGYIFGSTPDPSPVNTPFTKGEKKKDA